MVCCKISFTIWISQAVLYQENVSKADQNCVSDFTYIPLESIQKEKEQPMGEKDITEKMLERKRSRMGNLRNRKPQQCKKIYAVSHHRI